MEDEDARTFAAHNPRKLGLADWRRSNTDALILTVRRTIDEVNAAAKRRVRFGVSPFGIWANAGNRPGGSLTAGKESYSSLYADSRKWVKTRMLDYVAPQISWPFGHDSAAYAALTDWWCEVVRGTGVKLYIGHGAYRAGAPGWGPEELIHQVRFNRMRPEVAGSVFFSWRSLFGSQVDPGAVRLLHFLKGR